MASFFNGPAAETYDERNSKSAAISDNMHFLIRLVLSDLPEKARILAVGVGTGAEILKLCDAYPEWTFVGVDPSADMLKVCEKRLTQANVINRCSLINGYVQDVSNDQPFDAVLSILVGHFVKRDERVDFLKQMRDRLRDGGYLVNTEISGDFNANDSNEVIKNWSAMHKWMGSTPESLAKLPDILRNTLVVLQPAEVEDLFRQAGFDKPVRFFQSFMMYGWWAQKNSERDTVPVQHN